MSEFGGWKADLTKWYGLFRNSLNLSPDYCVVEFENVSIRMLHQTVSGNLKSGQLVAILGASGAGKTTLLAGISQRFRGPITGSISLNGSTIDRRSMAKISCFVPQFDIAFDTLTPNEHMHFMSELKLDRKWTTQRKRERIDFLLREVGLTAVADNRIITMSGGERKRLTMATDVSDNWLSTLIAIIQSMLSYSKMNWSPVVVLVVDQSADSIPWRTNDWLG